MNWLPYIFCLPICILAIFNAAAQNKVIVKDNHGKIIITSKEKTNEQVLSLSKYIDTTKEIFFVMGTNRIGVVKSINLKNGYSCSPFQAMGRGNHNDDKYINIRIEKSGLKISFIIDGFDQKYVAKIVNNKLITSKKYDLYTSDKYIELIDDYNIPVLQIELIKETNSINICGAFNMDDGYYICREDGMTIETFTKSKLLFSQRERDSLFNQYLFQRGE